MSGRVGSITTEIITDGLVFNMDAANRASYINNTAKETIDLVSGSINGTTFDTTNGIKSLTFDGIDDYINFGDILEQANDGTDKVTLSIWVKWTGTSTYIIFGKCQNASPYNGYTIQARESGKISFGLGTVNNWRYRKTNSSSFNDGTWKNVIATYNGNREVSGINIYINGSLVLMDSQLDVGTITNVVNIGDCNIGVRGNSSNRQFYFPGNLANAMQYNRELSSAEVLHNYNALAGRFGL